MSHLPAYSTKFTKFALLTVSLLILQICAVPVRGADGDSKILVFGDSLSSAYGMATDQGWVALLADKLREPVDKSSENLKRRWSVINASVPGDTASSGAERIQALLDRHSPDLVIIELGGNDGLRGTPVDTIQEALSTILDRTLDSGAAALLLGVRMPPNYGPRYVTEFHAVYRTLATERGIAWVPFLLEGVATVPGMMQADRVHPTAMAQPTMLETVWKVLGPLLQ